MVFFKHLFFLTFSILIMNCEILTLAEKKTPLMTYSFENAIPAKQLFIERTFKEKVRGMSLILNGRIKKNNRLFFAEVGFIRTTQGVPVILNRRDDVWTALPLGRHSHMSDQTLNEKEHFFDDLRGFHWKRVVGRSVEGMLYAILEYGYGDPGPIALLVSSDNGQTWELRCILEKIKYTAQFHDFAMTKAGVGRLTVAHLSPDSESTMGIKPGFYHYHTKDGGYTWSPPKYEAHDIGYKLSSHFYWKGQEIPKNLRRINPFITSFDQLLLLKY